MSFNNKKIPIPYIIAGLIAVICIVIAGILFIKSNAPTDNNTDPDYYEGYNNTDNDDVDRPDSETDEPATEGDFTTDEPETDASNTDVSDNDKTSEPDETLAPDETAEPDKTIEPEESIAPTPTLAPTKEPTKEADYNAYYFRNKKLLNQHYEKHGIEMGFEDAKAYEAAASAVINNPKALHKLEASEGDGDTVYYVEESNEFAILSADGYIRTYFLPSAGKKYYDRQ